MKCLSHIVSLVACLLSAGCMDDPITSVLSGDGELIIPSLRYTGVFDEAPFCIKTVAAKYPRSKDGRYETADILLAFTIDRDGTTKDVSVLIGKAADFDGSAKQALEECRFRPATRNGIPAQSTGSVIYSFAFRPIELIQPLSGENNRPNQAREATATAGMSAAGQPPRQP
jgi:TonB family protein